MWATYRTWECKEIGSANTLGLVCKSHLGILTPNNYEKIVTNRHRCARNQSGRENKCVTLSPGELF